MAGNAGSIYLEISVDDKGSIKVRDFSKEVEKAASSSSDSFQRVDRSAKRLDGSLDSLRSTAGRLAAAFGAYKVASFAKDATMATARYDTLGVVLERVGRNYGYSREELDKYTSELQTGGIAMLESRDVLLSMIQAEMDLTKARELSRAAQDAAVIGNVNSSEAFKAMVYGIQSAQVEVLRTIGINVNFEQSYKKAARAIGTTATALTEHQKVQVRTNAVLRAAQGIAGSYESAMQEAGKKVSSFTRYVDDFEAHMGRAFKPALTEGVDKATDAMKRLTEEVDKPETQERLSQLAATAVETAEDLAKVGLVSLDFLGHVADGWNQLPTIVQEVGLVGAVIGGSQARVAIGIMAAAIGLGKKLHSLVETDVTLDDVEQAQLELGQAQVEYDQSVAMLEQNRGYAIEGWMQKEVDQAEERVRQAQAKLTALTVASAQTAAALRGDFDDYMDRWNPNNRPTGSVVPAPEESTSNADKVARAIDSITVKLAAMNDTGTEGDARIASLNKAYNDFAKVLGKNNPKVKEFAEVIAYANDHYGHTPAEVAKSTRAVERNTAALAGEIEAVKQATDSYGHINRTKLEMLQAELEAEQRYQAAILDGVDPIVAARRRELEIEKAKGAASRENLEVLTEFHKEYLRLVKGESAMQMEAIEAQARVYREAGADAEAVAQWEAQAKLRASREWRDGAIRAFQDYSDAASDAAAHAEELVSTSMRGMEDAIINFVHTGKLEFTDLVRTIEDELLRMSIQKGITGPLSDMFGGFLGGLWPNAHGGAYASPSLARYEGKVVDRPTFFQFAHGASLGVAGEGRRKEVIAPLFRDPVTNDMGVRVHGAMAGGNTYYITQNFSLPTPSGDRETDTAYLEEAAKAYRKEMKAVFSEELRQAVQPGGQLNGGPRI
jgi:lambda family phage tail tape measure protein